MLRQIVPALVTVAAFSFVGCGTPNSQSERNRFASDKLASGNQVSGEARTDPELADAPLTISASNVGMFAKGHSWHLKVDTAGHAELTIDNYPDPIRKQFQVPKEQWAEFGKAVADGRFFELKGEYGKPVPCGSEQSVTVTAGQRAHTVKIYYLTSSQADKATLREASRAVQLLVLVRGWFEEPKAVDHREYDKLLLDAAKK